MSGVATIAAIASAAAAVGGTAYGVINGQSQSGKQDAALKRQKTAQDKAEGAALSTERQGEIAQGAANMKTPDIAGILQRAQQMSKAGIGSTMLTGPSGVDTGSLTLSSNSLLGK